MTWHKLVKNNMKKTLGYTVLSFKESARYSALYCSILFQPRYNVVSAWIVEYINCLVRDA